ncbi:hypothetical protein KBA63_02140 [Candidatus Woesebacteria bacterium]|nr:hypothetical protein [Candidatus Woesebacteria bacterium]MBP9687576.1 hypothetical protein [Candidatus Woesebacteria bacterium]
MDLSEQMAFQRLLSFFLGSIFASLLALAYEILGYTTKLVHPQLLIALTGLAVGAGITNFLYSEIANDRGQIRQVKQMVSCTTIMIILLVVFSTDQRMKTGGDTMQVLYLVVWSLFPLYRLVNRIISFFGKVQAPIE